MCIEIEVNGKICKTQGDLSKSLAGPLVMDYGPQNDDTCLCPVNIQSTAGKYGYSVVVIDEMSAAMEKRWG